MQVKQWVAGGWLPGETLLRPAHVPGQYVPLAEVEVFAVETNRPGGGGGGGGGRGRGRPRNAVSVDHGATQADVDRFFGGGGGSAGSSSY